MGVRRSDYIVIGLNIGYDKYDDERFEEFEDYMEQGKGEITYLIDGYSGKYFIVGEVIKCDKDGYEGLGVNEVSTTADTPFIAAKDRVRKFINEKFGINDEPKLIVLTHWT
jgi:hypothetical protein